MLGLAALVAGVYLVVVLGIGDVPTAHQTTLLVFSALAAAVVAVVYLPVRTHLMRLAAKLFESSRQTPDEVLRRVDRGLAMDLSLDELLLQVAEALREALVLASAEVWTGSGGLLQRVASDPDSGSASLILGDAEQAVVTRAGVSGRAWLRTWLPSLVDGSAGGQLRMVPITHADDLLGLILVERASGREPLTRNEEQLLVRLARQLGLALKNVRLGSALESSLSELQRQAEELRASRARVVAAADGERRRIERDLHDGAQQDLVSVAVNLRLARELAGSDPVAARSVLEDLAVEVKDAIEKFRLLAHGIYPPLLADRGLVAALQEAVRRSPLRGRFEAQTESRYSAELEATVYFCCLEALQNAAKHAGADTRISVRLWEEQGRLQFDVSDDGAGFEPARGSAGAGLANMRDRVGALDGRLSVSSTPGRGTRVSGTIPLDDARVPGDA
jgi:signal transduction histidine kinase